MNCERRIEELGIVLPSIAPMTGSFDHFVRSGNLLFCSGKTARDANGVPICGKVGLDYSADEAKAHARHIGELLLATIKAAVGDLGRVKRVVKLLGFVNAVPDFLQHPHVIDGCSELFVEVFGEKGRHARSAIGAGSLPNNVTVEIEAIIELDFENITGAARPEDQAKLNSK